MYACNFLDENGNCAEWVKMNNFIHELSSLTLDQSGQILSMTALLFAVAWIWKHLSLMAKKRG